MKYLVALLLSVMLAGCGTTEGLVAGLGVVGTVLGAVAKDADYAEYVQACKTIIEKQAESAAVEGNILLEAAKTRPSETLLYMALRPMRSGIQQCALAVPEGFFKSLAKNGNLLNFFATVYGINRSDAQSQRQMQNAKEMGLAQLSQEVQMERLRNDLISVFGTASVNSFKAGAEAATSAAP